MEILLSKPIIPIVLAALAYVGATVAMKIAASGGTLATFAFLALFLAAAAALEIIALQRTSLGVAYVMILGTETLLILGIAALIGEGLAPREMAGAALVFAGTAVLAT